MQQIDGAGRPANAWNRGNSENKHAAAIADSRQCNNYAEESIVAVLSEVGPRPSSENSATFNSEVGELGDFGGYSAGPVLTMTWLGRITRSCIWKPVW